MSDFMDNHNPADWPLSRSYQRFLWDILDAYDPWAMSKERALSAYGIDKEICRNPFFVCRHLKPEQVAKIYKRSFASSDYYFCKDANSIQTKNADYFKTCMGLIVNALNKVYRKEFAKVTTMPKTGLEKYDELIEKHLGYGLRQQPGSCTAPARED